ncbi:hypothetical protein CDL12_11992 [Handroanthus impetiginosus]|uniref:Uncharacterized protein n=1 Tax=Handroanthus impetiginosus TaxID=429701 RepID=A0A2G9HCW6_9LAMI|nr:hypothetical protein CDL12_11992 [Handroanthus impetiginosus]
MPHILSNTSKNAMQISNSFGSMLPEKMAAKSNPVAIGTRGSVGSLIMQEIDYFSQLEYGDSGSSSKLRELSKPKLDSVAKIPRKKKKGSRRLIPSMCSMVQVAENNQPSFVSGFTYKNLKRLQPN